MNNIPEPTPNPGQRRNQPDGTVATCSPDHRMPANARGRWQHTNVEEIGEQEDGWPGGDIVRLRCKNCGHVWTKELPQ